MDLKTSLSVTVVLIVVLPYLLVLLWCLALALGSVLHDWHIPKPVSVVLLVGGYLSVCARHDRFWTHMLWFPAFVFVAMATRNAQAAVSILALHLLAMLVLYLSDDRLTTMLNPRHE